jgi:hypothetical protein
LLRGLSMMGSGLPARMHFITKRAIAMLEPKPEPYHPNQAYDPKHLAAKTWRLHFDRLTTDCEDLIAGT